MKILIVSQVFWPDSASVSQHLTDLARALIVKGHRVRVLSSRNGYEDPCKFYPAQEFYQGICIRRLRQTAFKKRNRIGRALNFLTFNISLLCALLSLGKGSFDVIIGTTVPPQSSFLNAFAARLKKIRFCHWAMDFQPELSIVAGYLNKHSPLALLLFSLNNYAFKRADLIIVLDKYMADYLISRGISSSKIKIIPVWPVLEGSYGGMRSENPFRLKHGMIGRVVVMYSGNLSVVHPLDTLLDAIEKLKTDRRFLFVFIGAGVRSSQVSRFKHERDLGNILQLPYQPREVIHFSLSAADLHVVIHGNGCTGYTHPNKIYGAMLVGRPLLYIGPYPSHITDILQKCPGNLSIEHGQIEKLVTALRAFADMADSEKDKIGDCNKEFVNVYFNKNVLIDRIISTLETLCLLEGA